jgi:hypothetical protein
MFASAKRRSLTGLISAMLVATAFIGHSAIAQSTTDTPPHTRPQIDFAKTLGLDDARATQLRSILDKSMTARHALMQQIHSAATDADREAVRVQMKALHDATHKEIAALLTADELAKFEELMLKPHKPPMSN